MNDAKEVSADLTVGMALYPNLTQLDVTGPYEVFARMPRARTLLLAAELRPVRSQYGLTITPDLTFGQAPPLDILFVPGGSPGVDQMLRDQAFLGFLRERGPQARYVTSVCTGALLLGAAGLLNGYRAATHWLSMDLLGLLGAIPVEERVVVDRNRITGGGVTAGIDVALTIAATLFGNSVAQEIELFLEYAPQPPFGCGSPRLADPALVARVREAHRARQEERRRLVEEAAAHLGQGAG